MPREISTDYDEVTEHSSALNDRTTLQTMSVQHIPIRGPEEIPQLARKKVIAVNKKTEKVCIAPGEHGVFRNWGEDVFLEEKCFPHLFPYGVGGYMSSELGDEKKGLGFANYVRHRLLHVDSKFRQDTVYLFFLLLVKESVELNRCKQTYLRQARIIPNLSNTDLVNLNHEYLSRYNRSFQVFRNMRGTSPYYQQAKKDLMAILRQAGCPNVFPTVACAEYKWDMLIKEILEVERRQSVSIEEVKQMKSAERNRVLSKNAVISTVHFQKRIDKIFKLFENRRIFHPYTMADYYYRIEFTKNGVPHLHCLVWLIDENGCSLKTLYSPGDIVENCRQLEVQADNLISGSVNNIECIHDNLDRESCEKCNEIEKRVMEFNTHRCRVSCHKKRKTITIKSSEGHGKHTRNEQEIPNFPICRYNFPQFPMPETSLILAPVQDLDKEEVSRRKRDCQKIRKYLIRQTGYNLGKREDNESWKKLSEMSFYEFLDDVGMGENIDTTSTCSKQEQALQRYKNALSTKIKGNGSIFLKRNPCDVFTNNFNAPLMELHEANHDMQIVCDPYGCIQYVCDYLTKGETGVSKILQELSCEKELSQMQLLNKISAILDKHREVSAHEATYRLLGLPMVKSSVKVKYINTSHPNKRDGLLKNVQNVEENESPFHNNPFTYYENRPLESIEGEYEAWNPHLFLEKDASEKAQRCATMEAFHIESWDDMCLADFWSCYDLVYGNEKNVTLETVKRRNIQDNLETVRLRGRRAVLRYYLKFEDEETLKRALLILFLPFRNELKELHQKDILKLFADNESKITKNRLKFEKMVGLAKLLADIEQERGDTDGNDEESDENFEETTSEIDLRQIEEDFDSCHWITQNSDRLLKTVKQFIDTINMDELRKMINGLNSEQRKIFDDIIEREVESEEEKQAYHVFISGEAGTGKSHLLKVIIEALKNLKVKSGDRLNKPYILALAPTANAAFIIGGKTIDSAFGFFGNDNTHTLLDAEKLASLQFLYEDISVYIFDEVSMFGSMKLTRVHFRAQELAMGADRFKFMGGRSSIACGDFYQLPPVFDDYIFLNNNLDGRPDCAPSHWNENYKIVYLTEKIRSQSDPKFGEVCDRVGKNEITKEDVEYLKCLVREDPYEESNEEYTSGKFSIIVTNNKLRATINQHKVNSLIPDEETISIDSEDICTNLASAPPLPNNLCYTKAKNLPQSLILKVGTPVLITINDRRYKEDGIVNGAKGFVDSFQMKGTCVEVIWVVFNDKNIGQKLRRDKQYLRRIHSPSNPKATPIVKSSKYFSLHNDTIKYRRKQFPLISAYAVTTHKSQGSTLSRARLDFSSDENQTAYIRPGSFYTAMTRVKNSNALFLKDFDRTYIVTDPRVPKNLEEMRRSRPYIYKKIYI